MDLCLLLHPAKISVTTTNNSVNNIFIVNQHRQKAKGSTNPYPLSLLEKQKHFKLYVKQHIKRLS